MRACCELHKLSFLLQKSFFLCNNHYRQHMHNGEHHSTHGSSQKVHPWFVTIIHGGILAYLQQQCCSSSIGIFLFLCQIHCSAASSSALHSHLRTLTRFKPGGDWSCCSNANITNEGAMVTKSISVQTENRYASRFSLTHSQNSQFRAKKQASAISRVYSGCSEQ